MRYQSASDVDGFYAPLRTCLKFSFMIVFLSVITLDLDKRDIFCLPLDLDLICWGDVPMWRPRLAIAIVNQDGLSLTIVGESGFMPSYLGS